MIKENEQNYREFKSVSPGTIIELCNNYYIVLEGTFYDLDSFEESEIAYNVVELNTGSAYKLSGDTTIRIVDSFCYKRT